MEAFMTVQWISFFEKQPEHGQGIWYYGECIGVWAGKYIYDPNDPVSHHLMICDESPGVVDRMDAPYWQPRFGQTKPEKPSQPYPKDYPS